MSSSRMATALTVSTLRAHVTAWREKREVIALVPTMGALHAGHISLVKLAKAQADRVVVSVFVNPRQFNQGEDFGAYPRSESADAQALQAAGCDLMFAPPTAEMYPAGFSTSITVGGVSEPLEGAARPGHFAGVATVVTKLLLQSRPDMAVFGEKDWQQLVVIRRLVRDLDLPIDILAVPTARDAQGLALSSRNARLEEDERRIAPRLYAVLTEAASALRGGAPVSKVEANARAALGQLGFGEVDYVEVRDPDTLAHPGPGKLEKPARLFAAAWLGKTRLIDNIPVPLG